MNTIVDCVFDVYFESNNVNAESFLTLFGSVNDHFDEIIKLPISQIPDTLRKNDPNLKLQPIYEIRSQTNNAYRILVGDMTIGIAVNQNSYTSWEQSFFPQIKKVFLTIFKSEKIKKITRIGLRYINFLPEEDIFKTGKISVQINTEHVKDKKISLRIEDKIAEISYNKSVANNTKYQNNSEKGSIIDITTFIDEMGLVIDSSFNSDIFLEKANQIHTLNEAKFKEVISDELARKYNIL